MMPWNTLLLYLVLIWAAHSYVSVHEKCFLGITTRLISAYMSIRQKSMTSGKKQERKRSQSTVCLKWTSKSFRVGVSHIQVKYLVWLDWKIQRWRTGSDGYRQKIERQTKKDMWDKWKQSVARTGKWLTSRSERWGGRQRRVKIVNGEQHYFANSFMFLLKSVEIDREGAEQVKGERGITKEQWLKKEKNTIKHMWQKEL